MSRIKYAIGVGGSMRPLLKNGDVLFFEPVPPANIKPGDVALYDAGGSMCCHRVWWKKDSLVCLAGDSGTAKAIFKDISCVKAKLVDSRPWSKGITGLIYSLVCAAVFNLLRPIKRKILRQFIGTIAFFAFFESWNFLNFLSLTQRTQRTVFYVLCRGTRHWSEK